MEDDIGGIADDHRESYADNGAVDAEHDGFEGEAEEDFGTAEPHGFA